MRPASIPVTLSTAIDRSPRFLAHVCAGDLGPASGTTVLRAHRTRESNSILILVTPIKISREKKCTGPRPGETGTSFRTLSRQSHRGGTMWAAEALTSQLLGRPGAQAALCNQRPGAGEGRGPYDNSAELPSRNMSRRGCNRRTPAAESRQPCPGHAAAELEGRGGGHWAWSGLLTAQMGPTTLRSVQPIPRAHFPAH